MGELLKEYLLFLKREKKWWLIPLILILLGISVLILFIESSAIAPFLYPLF
jgi:hypothetical protein